MRPWYKCYSLGTDCRASDESSSSAFQEKPQTLILGRDDAMNWFMFVLGSPFFLLHHSSPGSEIFLTSIEGRASRCALGCIGLYSTDSLTCVTGPGGTGWRADGSIQCLGERSWSASSVIGDASGLQKVDWVSLFILTVVLLDQSFFPP